MSSLPRRTNQTDAEWQAITARTGKFNEENYGKKKPGNPAPPMTKGPVSPKAPPTMTKGPVSPKPAMTRLEAARAKFASMRAARDARRGASPVTSPRGSGTNDGGPMPTSFPSAPGGVKTPVANLNASPKPIAKGGVVKKAAGGAAKVRKGMMTSEGTITHAMNKVRGK